MVDKEVTVEWLMGNLFEPIRIDPGTAPAYKGPNTSHFHLDGGNKHIFNINKWPWWNN